MTLQIQQPPLNNGCWTIQARAAVLGDTQVVSDTEVWHAYKPRARERFFLHLRTVQEPLARFFERYRPQSGWPQLWRWLELGVYGDQHEASVEPFVEGRAGHRELVV